MSSRSPRPHIRRTATGQTITDFMAQAKELAYEDAVIAWQRSLKPTELASMEEDYRRGLRDEVTCDAHEEYMRRRQFRSDARLGVGRAASASSQDAPSSAVDQSPPIDSMSA